MHFHGSVKFGLSEFLASSTVFQSHDFVLSKSWTLCFFTIFFIDLFRGKTSYSSPTKLKIKFAFAFVSLFIRFYSHLSCGAGDIFIAASISWYSGPVFSSGRFLTALQRSNRFSDNGLPILLNFPTHQL